MSKESCSWSWDWLPKLKARDDIDDGEDDHNFDDNADDNDNHGDDKSEDDERKDYEELAIGYEPRDGDADGGQDGPKHRSCAHERKT